MKIIYGLNIIVSPNKIVYLPINSQTHKYNNIFKIYLSISISIIFVFNLFIFTVLKNYTTLTLST